MGIYYKYKHLFSTIINLGIEESYSYIKTRKIRLVNYIAFFTATVWLLFAVWVLFYQLYSVAIIDALGALSSIVVLWLNFKKRYTTAFYIISIFGLFFILLISISEGRVSGAHYFIPIWIINGIFLLNKKQEIVVFALIGVLSYVGVEYHFDNFDPLNQLRNQTDPTAFMQYILLFIALGVEIMFIMFFKLDVQHYESTLENKNLILEEQKEEITQQKELLEEQTTEIEAQKDNLNNAYQNITSSVNYARSIQKSILTPQWLIKERINSLFVINKPKDIVSGDFYWFAEKDNKQLIAVVDCTGHGVPGAFMTAIGNTLLNQIVIDIDIDSPAKIIKELHIRLLNTLNYHLRNNKIDDGMDLALCIIDEEKGQIAFSGAKRPLFQFSNNNLIIHKATNSSIGGINIKSSLFHEININYKNGDRFYMFTDGIHDQFSEKTGKKLTIKRFKQMILDIQSIPIYQQKKAIEEYIYLWQGNYDQTDDILLLAFQL